MGGRSRPYWRLDNSLLLSKEVRTQVRKEIKDFFLVHAETQNKVILWDTIKACIWGVFISLKASLNRKRHEASAIILQDIVDLETLHKRKPEKGIKEELDLRVAKLRVIETTQAATPMLYLRQQIFEFRDRPNKMLARILAQENP